MALFDLLQMAPAMADLARRMTIPSDPIGRLKAMNAAAAAGRPMDQFAGDIGLDLGALPAAPGADIVAEAARRRQGRELAVAQNEEMLRREDESFARNQAQLEAMNAAMQAPRNPNDWVDITGLADRMRGATPSEAPSLTRQGLPSGSNVPTRRAPARTPEEKEWSRQAVRNKGIARGLGIDPAMFPIWQQAQQGDPQAQIMLGGMIDPRGHVPQALGALGGHEADAEARLAAMEAAVAQDKAKNDMLAEQFGQQMQFNRDELAARGQQVGADLALRREAMMREPKQLTPEQQMMMSAFGNLDWNNPEAVAQFMTMRPFISQMLNVGAPQETGGESWRWNGTPQGASPLAGDATNPETYLTPDMLNRMPASRVATVKSKLPATVEENLLRLATEGGWESPSTQDYEEDFPGRASELINGLSYKDALKWFNDYTTAGGHIYYADGGRSDLLRNKGFNVYDIFYKALFPTYERKPYVPAAR